MIRVIQLSDTHLGAAAPHFHDNWSIIAKWVRRERPDLVINTGDISLDGADDDADLTFAIARHSELGCPVFVVPGNHDIGDHPQLSSGRQIITDRRRRRYLEAFGSDFWSKDLEGWRMIGIDALLIGSGLSAEVEQRAWLRTTIDGAGDRLVALFLHKPFFIDTPKEDAFTYWCVEPTLRRSYDFLWASERVRLISSGHLHQYRSTRIGHQEFLWAPSTSFVCGQSAQPDELGGVRRVGLLDLRFADSEVTSSFVEPPGLANTVIDDILHEIYPPRPAVAGEVAE